MLTCRADNDLYQRIKALSEETGYSISEIIRLALEELLGRAK